jgi:hypothetical protein
VSFVIRRIFMVILIACLAAPAIAMPMAHEAGSTMNKGHCDDRGSSKADDGKAVALHGCIGCLAPFQNAVIAEGPLPMPAIRLVDIGQTQLVDLGGAPDTPPPRR